MPAPSAPEIILGERRFAASRYLSYRVSGNRNRMYFKFRDPDETVKIDGAENVAMALLEIESVMSPSDTGWNELD